VVRCVGWLVDRPSKRQRSRESLRTGLEAEAGCSSALGRAGSPDAAKSSLRDPQGWWIGLSKRQAAVGDDRAGRSSRPSRSGQRPTGAGPDALLLLLILGRRAAARLTGVGLVQASQRPLGLWRSARRCCDPSDRFVGSSLSLDPTYGYRTPVPAARVSAPPGAP
jgi:hypothetical protein